MKPKLESQAVEHSAIDQSVWKSLCIEYERLFGESHPAVIYGLPELLIEALNKKSKGLLTDAELDFELRLHDSLGERYAVGFDDGRPIHSSLFEERSAVLVSPEDFEALGWEKSGLTLEGVNCAAEEIENRALPFHEQLVAYAGWLLTNPQFIQELALLREQEAQFIAAESSAVAENIVRQMNDFLARWQLANMTTWDLPEPQGPNLSGTTFPESARRGADGIPLEFTMTTKLPARFPIRDLLAEIRQHDAGAHLADWQQVLSTEKTQGPGIIGYGRTLHIRFFRDTVLSSRYGERFVGRHEDLDRAFGDYLGVSSKSIKALRVEISRRLRPVTAGK